MRCRLTAAGAFWLPYVAAELALITACATVPAPAPAAGMVCTLAGDEYLLLQEIPMVDGAGQRVPGFSVRAIGRGRVWFAAAEQLHGCRP